MRLILALVFSALLASPVAGQWTNITMDLPPLIDCWAISDSTVMAITDSNRSYLTHDAGSTWQELRIDTCDSCAVTLRKIQFFSPGEGYIWGAFEGVDRTYVTTDTGRTWSQMDTMIADAEYVSRSFGYTTDLYEESKGSYTSLIRATRDLGRSWDTIFSRTINSGAHGAAFFTGFSGKASGLAAITLYGGSSKYHNFIIDTFGVVKQINNLPEHLWPLAPGRWIGQRHPQLDGVLRSDDRGETWTTVSDPNIEWVDYHQLRGDSVFATRQNPFAIALSTDAGATWSMDDTIANASMILRLRKADFSAGLGHAYALIPVNGEVEIFRRDFRKAQVAKQPDAPPFALLKVNPSDNSLTLEVHEDVSYTVIDLLGRIIRNGLLQVGIARIDVSGDPPGAYAIVLRTPSREQVISYIKR